MRKSLKLLENKFLHQPRYFFPLANAYRDNHDLDKCIELFRRGLAIFPHYWAPRVALGRALIEKGALDEALKELEMAVSHIPENLLLHRLLASIYLRKGDLSKAARYCQLVLFVAPQDKEALSMMNEISKNYQGQSQPTFKKQGHLSPEEEPEIITPTIAELYLSQGLAEKAIEIYQKLLGQQPDHEEWKKRLLCIQKELGIAMPPQLQREKAQGKVLEQLETWLKNIEKNRLNPHSRRGPV